MWFHSCGGGTEETGGILEPLLEQEVAFPPVSLSSRCSTIAEKLSEPQNPFLAQLTSDLCSEVWFSVALLPSPIPPHLYSVNRLCIQWDVPLYYLHFMDEKTEAQGPKETYARSHNVSYIALMP